MNDLTPPTKEQREARLEGMGCKRKRVEDIRFTQGKGHYVDDMKLPGMLFGDFVRSTYAHARIKSIDTSKAKALPGVRAVLTAADLKHLRLVDEVITEPLGGAHRDAEATVASVGRSIEEALKPLIGLDASALKAQRREKFLAMGREGVA